MRRETVYRDSIRRESSPLRRSPSRSPVRDTYSRSTARFEERKSPFKTASRVQVSSYLSPADEEQLGFAVKE